MITSFRILLIALVISAGASVTSAQVPDNIPVDPEKSLADRQRERFEERHHAAFSRFFASSNLAVGPSLLHDTALIDLVVEGGFDLSRGDAIRIAVGSRSYPVEEATGRQYSTESWKLAYVFAMGYDVSLSRVIPTSSWAQRSVLGISVGGLLDDVGVITVDVGPKYIFPVNRFWSVPLGLKLSTAILGDMDSNVAMTFIGASVGVKRHFGQRRRLDLK